MNKIMFRGQEWLTLDGSVLAKSQNIEITEADFDWARHHFDHGTKAREIEIQDLEGTQSKTFLDMRQVYK